MSYQFSWHEPRPELGPEWILPARCIFIKLGVITSYVVCRFLIASSCASPHC